MNVLPFEAHQATAKTAVRRCAFLVGVGIIICLMPAPATGQKARPGPRVTFGVCEREAAKLTSDKPVRVGRGTRIRAPRKLHDAKIKWPTDTRSRIGRGVWVGEALIEPDGRIRHVWPLREIQFTPPWPELNEAFVVAIKQWVFEPTRLEGRPVPVCMPVTVNINWQ